MGDVPPRLLSRSMDRLLALQALADTDRPKGTEKKMLKLALVTTLIREDLKDLRNATVLQKTNLFFLFKFQT